MSVTLSPITNTQVFGTWLSRTNQALAVISSNAVTTDNTAIGGFTSGNGTVNGYFAANTLIARDYIRGGNVTSSNNLFVSSNAIFQYGSSNLVYITGNASSSNVGITVSTVSIISSQNTNINSNNISISTTLDSNLTSNNIYLNSTGFNVSGNTYIVGNINADNMLYINSYTNVVTSNASTVIVNSNTSFNGSNLVSTANTFLNNELTVVNSVSFSNTLSVTGNVSLSNTLTVSGNVTFSNTLSVTDNVTFSNTLSVTGNVTFSNNLNVSSNVYISNNLLVNNYVGIGTKTPLYNLVISNSGNEGLEIAPGYSSGRLFLQAYDRTASAYVILDNNAGQHTWQISGSEKMRLNTSGYLGIGTNSPSQLLEVNGNTKINNTLSVGPNISNSSGFYTTGTINSTSYTIGSAVTINSSGINTPSVNSTVYTIGTFGSGASAFYANSTYIGVGNNTVNVYISSTNTGTSLWANNITCNNINIIGLISGTFSVTGNIIPSGSPATLYIGTSSNTFGYSYVQTTTTNSISSGVFGQNLYINSNTVFQNNAVFSNSISVANSITTNSLSVGSVSGLFTNNYTFSNTSEATVDNFPIASYRSGEYIIQLTDSSSGNKYHTTKILVLHDGTTPYVTEYGTLYSSSVLGTFRCTISGGNLNLLCTPFSSSTVVKLTKILTVV